MSFGIVVGVAPLLIHHLTLAPRSAWLVGAVSATQIAAILWVFGRRFAVRYRAIVVVGMLALGRSKR